MKPQFGRSKYSGWWGMIGGSLLAAGLAAAAWRAPVTVVAPDTLGGRDRYLAHVTTDKPIYRAGEMVYIRAIVLDAATRTPHAARTPVHVEIKGPQGNTVATLAGHLQDGVAGIPWPVPAGQAGGAYKVAVEVPQIGTPPAVRGFDIRAYRAPRINTRIEFLREGYGPGDTVVAVLEAVRAEGGVPIDAAVTIMARVDGAEIHRSTAMIDADGRCGARFELPADIVTGDGTLVFTIADGGVIETAAKTIPILLQTVDIRIYPESGDLVAGLAGRVYIEARTPAGKPADIAGVIHNAAGEQVGTFRTDHEGRGRFSFMPVVDQVYYLAVTEPAGIDRTFELPPVRPTGVSIRAVHDVYPAGEPVVLQVHGNVKGPLSLTLRKREVEVAALTLRGAVNDGQRHTADVILTPSAAADGVLIATVWDADGIPLAERLIYREPAQHVRITVAPDREGYTPGERVRLVVTATDGAGRPVEALVGLTVTDESVLEMIEQREQAPRLPVMVLLESDVREIGDAHVYLDPENPDASRAVDLLLGTQGWRRFALLRFDEFIKQYGDDARRALAVRRPRQELFPGMSGMIRREAAARIDELGHVMEDGFAFVEMEAAEAPPPPLEALPVPPPLAAPSVRGDDLLMAAGEFDVAQDRERIIGDRRQLPGPRRPEAMAFVSVREYAHKARTGRQPNDRIDFTETLYWSAGVKTDPQTGQATVAFDLNDAVTTFRVLADAFTAQGALGAGDQTIASLQPFYIEPKLPLEVTMGDRIILPVSVINAGASDLTAAWLRINAVHGITVGDLPRFDIAAGTRPRRLVDLGIGDVAAEISLVIEVLAAPYADTVTRPLRIVPRGFPVELADGGMLGPESPLRLTVRIPETRVPGSVRSAMTVYPTPLANLTEALERLIRQPHGCFEQTSSTTYPLVMAQQYFMTHHGVDPKLIERSREMLEAGYQRLTGFECKSHGFEWFGADPGHEALTAYGLLLFSDMAKVYPVDPVMVARTREWLLRARDGKGGFKRERRALHTWIEDRDCSNAYITWALLEAGEPPATLKPEIETVTAAALASANSYVVALGAHVAWLAGDRDTARRLMQRLADAQVKDGSVDGGTATIVGSRGQSLQIETTALAVLAWLRDPAFTPSVEQGIRWLADICKGGRFGSTQSTVLALRAIVTYDAARARPKTPGTLQVFVNDRAAGSAVAFDEDTRGAIQLPDIAELLEPGEHRIEIRMTDGAEMPASITIGYADEQPDSSPECKLDITVTLSAAAVGEGEVLEARVTVSNREEDEILPMPLAIVGIPGGLEVHHDHLKELVGAGRIAAYEVIGRDVVLYWRELQAGRSVDLPIRLVAEIPGTYTGPASRVYQYYADEFKTWAAPLTVTITPARQ